MTSILTERRHRTLKNYYVLKKSYLLIKWIKINQIPLAFKLFITLKKTLF